MIFELAAAGFAVALVPAGAAVLRGPATQRAVALTMTATVLVLLFLALAAASGQAPLQDLALTLAVVSYGGGLVFARFLERWV